MWKFLNSAGGSTNPLEDSRISAMAKPSRRSFLSKGIAATTGLAVALVMGTEASAQEGGSSGTCFACLQKQSFVCSYTSTIDGERTFFNCTPHLGPGDQQYKCDY